MTSAHPTSAGFNERRSVCHFRLTSDTGELIHSACQALTRIFRASIRYNKCGVMLAELTPGTEHHAGFAGSSLVFGV